MKPSAIAAAAAAAAARARATDFIIRKFCSEEAQEAQQFNEHQRAHGRSSLIEYDADRDFQWIKEQQPAYDAAVADTTQGARFILRRNRAFTFLIDAERLVTLLLDPSATAFHCSSRMAARQRKQLQYFEEVPEFRALVPSAVSRVMH